MMGHLSGGERRVRAYTGPYSIFAVPSGKVTELDNVPGCNPAVGSNPWRFESSPSHHAKS